MSVSQSVSASSPRGVQSPQGPLPSGEADDGLKALAGEASVHPLDRPLAQLRWGDPFKGLARAKVSLKNKNRII